MEHRYPWQSAISFNANLESNSILYITDMGRFQSMLRSVCKRQRESWKYDAGKGTPQDSRLEMHILVPRLNSKKKHSETNRGITLPDGSAKSEDTLVRSTATMTTGN